jgi:hypothetical protein
MDQQIAPRLRADLFLLHAPSVVALVYEMCPIGWFSITQPLADCGFDAKIVNVASLMLMHLIGQPDRFHRKDSHAGSRQLRMRMATNCLTAASLLEV